MTTGAKVLIAAAILCFVLWGAAIAVRLRPLIPAAKVQVVYSEGEDFFSDGAAYRKFRNNTFIIVHLPRARPAYRWWTVDLNGQTISLTGPPRSIGRLRYALKGDLAGSNIAAAQIFPNWYWHFAENEASFSGSGFSCTVRKDRNK